MILLNDKELLPSSMVGARGADAGVTGLAGGTLVVSIGGGGKTWGFLRKTQMGFLINMSFLTCCTVWCRCGMQVLADRLLLVWWRVLMSMSLST